MAEIAVLHNTFDFRGGADAVCLHVCAALSADHDVTVFTISETSPTALASQFDVDIDVAVRSPPAATAIARSLSTASPVIGTQLAARSAALARYARPRLGEFDLAVSTTNELALPIPSVQYVHVPQFHRRSIPEIEGGRLNRLWSALAAPPRHDAGSGVRVPLRRDSGSDAVATDRERHDRDAETTLLANSVWTADRVAAIYGRRPDVLYPPVDPIPGEPWEQREEGVVFVGRLAPDKRVLAAIDVVDRVRDRGIDVHLHVVGTVSRAHRHYAEQVATAAARRPYVHLERDATRERLESLLGRHKFGLNTKPAEHFGMAVAEYVAAGMIAFAPDSGGQRDVLQRRSDRLFDSTEEAATLVADAVADDERPDQQRDRFASDRFRRAFREYVSTGLERSGSHIGPRV
jgi:glycosyltransferase involved in cell wall biosynthesis